MHTPSAIRTFLVLGIEPPGVEAPYSETEMTMEEWFYLRYGGGMSHLYIMQNHVGFIKVGRSAWVEKRRRELQRDNACIIAVVAIVEDAGEFEETMLMHLDDHRLIGEWFVGDKLCRDCVAIETETLSKVLERQPPKLDWPYPLADDDATSAWIVRCEELRLIASINREYSTIINRMRKGESNDRGARLYWDGRLWALQWRVERRVGASVAWPIKNSGDTLVGHREGLEDGEIVPRYTTDITAALTLFPPQDRPTKWIGSAWECCITAIMARRAALCAGGLAKLSTD